MSANLKAGDFTGLAGDYSKHRPDYSPEVLDKILNLIGKPVSQIDFVDVGAGTGIWTRMVYDRKPKSVIAIEPNDDMRANGIADSKGTTIRWGKGTAEKTGVENSSCDWVSMASSFHWADFDQATCEFYRILKPGGFFTALWNPRLIEVNPLLVEIENHLQTLRPNIKRVSSGRSGITHQLTELLSNSPYFKNPIYMEGQHVIQMTPERYLGAWRSVNDLRVQLGSEKFDSFLSFVEKKTQGLNTLEATYLTRAWTAQRKD